MGKVKRKFYMCGVDWQHEIGEAPDLEGRMPIYSTVEELKAKRTCWPECGILEIVMTESQWIVKQDLYKKSIDKKEDE
jgi:hypothetical protein